jgi:hypothetical protein
VYCHLDNPSIAYLCGGQKCEILILSASQVLGLNINMISVIIPTMWRFEPFIDFLRALTEVQVIGEIIVIDNDQTKTPSSAVLAHPKVRHVQPGRNMLVNPSWNWGAETATYETLCILNDDVVVDLRAFVKANDFINDQMGVLGICPGYSDWGQPPTVNGAISIIPHTDQHTLGFGTMMFIARSNWRTIPAGLDIYYGDNFIFDQCLGRGLRNYLMTDTWYYSPMATTTSTLPDQQIILDRETKIYQRWQTQGHAQTKLQKEYQTALGLDTDINQHLPMLSNLAAQCSTVTEFGVRSGQSTRAFLVNDCRLRSYDLYLDPEVVGLFELARIAGHDAEYLIGNTLELHIEPVDLLFIDTQHTYQQLTQELARHGNQAKKYLVFHDTHTYGTKDEIGSGPGLLPAVLEFLADNPHWQIYSHSWNNNGLTVLARQ